MKQFAAKVKDATEGRVNITSLSCWETFAAF